MRRPLHFTLFELGVLALLTPLALLPTPARSVALLAIPGLWLCRWFIARRHSPSLPISPSLIPRTPLDLPILILALMVLISLYATYDIAVSLPKIAGVVFGIGLYYATVGATQGFRRWCLGLAVFVLGGVGVAALGLLGSKWIDKFPILSPIIQRLPARLTGLPGAEGGFHPNEVAGALLWVVPLALALAAEFVWTLHVEGSTYNVQRSASTRILAGIGVTLAAGFTTGVLVLTQSRGGLIGFAVALLAMLLVAGRNSRLFLLLVALALAGSVMLGAATLGPERLTGLLSEAGGDAVGPQTLNTLDGRLELWSRGIYGMQDFAFTGMGMNTFRTVVHVLYPLFLIGPDTDIGHAHNMLIQVALDLGIPGLIAYLALWVGAGWMLVQVWRASVQRSTLNVQRASFQRAVALGIGGGLLAHFVYGITDTVALGAKPGVLWWVMLGLMAGLYGLSEDGHGITRATESH